MGLLSIFKRQGETPRAAPAGESGDEVQRARTRARRRLIGAAVLLGVGIVGFPLVFETQPRPIPVNIPIEAPAKDGAPPLAMPAARPAVAAAASTTTAAAPAPAAAPSKPAGATPAPMITESREEAGREVASAAPAASAAAPARVASKPVAPPKPVAEAKPVEPAPKVADAKPDPKPAANDAARARALLEGKSEPAGSDAGRFVVQVGAFADVAAAHETRAKVEKLGLKTYTQVASTASGKRIRVRAGPYNSRAEADKALAKARAAGLTAVVLTL